MTRTCPYCGTKIKQSFWFFAPECTVCPTCEKKPFHPVFKQLRAVRICCLSLIGILLILLIIPDVWHPLLPEWIRSVMNSRFFIWIPVILSLVGLILRDCFTRDRHVKRMYEKEQRKETPNGI